MKHAALLALLLLLNACGRSRPNKQPVSRPATASDYSNNPSYSVSIGDTVEIYYTTNSCCQYCQPNAAALSHLEYIGQKVVIPEPGDCEGCNHTSALLFVAKSKGTDTIYGGSIPPLADCNASLKELEKFIVAVRF